MTTLKSILKTAHSDAARDASNDNVVRASFLDDGLTNFTGRRCTVLLSDDAQEETQDAEIDLTDEEIDALADAAVASRAMDMAFYERQTGGAEYDALVAAGVDSIMGEGYSAIFTANEKAAAEACDACDAVAEAIHAEIGVAADALLKTAQREGARVALFLRNQVKRGGSLTVKGENEIYELARVAFRAAIDFPKMGGVYPTQPNMLAGAEFIAGVKAFALENYTKGWDIIVEATEDSELGNMIQGARTLNGAIRKVGEYVRIHNSAAAEMQ